MSHKAKAWRWLDVFVFAMEIRNLASLCDDELLSLFICPAAVLSQCRSPPFTKILFPSLFSVTHSSMFTTLSSKPTVLQPRVVLKDLG